MPSSGEKKPLLPTRDQQDDDEDNRDPGKSTNNLVVAITVFVLLAIFVTLRVLPKARESEVFMATLSNDGSGQLEIVRVRSKDNSAKDGVAFGEFIYNPDLSQWSYLTLETAQKIESKDDFLHSMYGMGFIEGSLTCTGIRQYYHNFASTINSGLEVSSVTKTFVAENWEWTKRQAALEADKDAFWMHVQGVVAQVEGMLDGYLKCDQTDLSKVSLAQRKNAHWAVSAGVDTMTMNEPTILQMLMLSGNGDLFQIMSVSDHIAHRTGAHQDPEDPYGSDGGGVESATVLGRDTSTPGSVLHVTNTTSLDVVLEKTADLHRRLLHTPGGSLTPDHCSALIKAVPDGSDVVFSHTTWDSFSNAAPRIFKRYHMRTPAGRLEMHFSSSPGMMSSVDDFYTVNALRNKDGAKSSLAVIETSIDVFNMAAIQSIVPESLLSWVRVRVANELSASGEEWARNFETHFSGTYSNQWMVQDLLRFEAGSGSGFDSDSDSGSSSAKHALKDGYLTILEEVPGLIMWQDATNVLRETGYWASYNMPYFKGIGARTGAAGKCQVNPDECHDTAPRALQFKKQQETATSLAGMMAAISYNDFEFDPVSKDNSCRAIACREDLEVVEKDRRAFGAIDAKVSSLLNSKRDLSLNQVPTKHMVRLGPTQEVSGRERPFCWSEYHSPPPDENGVLVELLDEVSPLGHPDCFDGAWQNLPPYLASQGWLIDPLVETVMEKVV
jgi:hypothetical protein